MLALEGAKELLKKPAYLATFLIASFVFAYVFTFFKDGTMNWSLVFSGLDFSEKLKILGQVVPEIFTVLGVFIGIYMVTGGASVLLECINAKEFIIRDARKTKAAAKKLSAKEAEVVDKK